MTATQFSIFHIDEPDGPGRHGTGEAYEYHELVNLAFRSVALFHPGCGRTLLTDNQTVRWEGLPSDVAVKRGPADPRLMLARLEAEIGFVRDAPAAALLVSLDGDILVNCSLAGLADGTWDIALTYRDDEEWPINGGVAFVDGGRRGNALKFLDQVRLRYLDDEAADSGWWGHQRALIETLGRAEFAARDADEMVIDGVAVRLLPCDTFNFSPSEDGRDLGRELRDRRVLHFKGSRKVWMAPYFRAYLATRESRSPMALLGAAVSRARLRIRSRQRR